MDRSDESRADQADADGLHCIFALRRDFGGRFEIDRIRLTTDFGDWYQGSKQTVDRPRGVRPVRIAPIPDLKAKLSPYVDECAADGPIVTTRNGKAVAVVLATNDDDDLERILLGRPLAFRRCLISPGKASITARDFPVKISGRRSAKGLANERGPRPAAEINSECC